MHIFGIRIKKPKVAGFGIQTSVQGLPIPIVYGTARLSGNIIHFPAQPTPSGSGGKGSSKSNAKSGTGQNYTAPVVIALCEGPITGLGFVWKDKDQEKDFTTYLAPAGWSLFTGTSSQAAWSYLSSNFSAQAVPYQFTAYVANSAVSLPNAQMSQYGWEVTGFLVAGGGVIDANPAAVINDFLTSTQYGCNFPSANVGSLTNMTNYCAAAGLFISPVVASQQPARDIINEWLEIANTAVVWSDNTLKFVPYGDTSITGYGHTYTPNTTPAYDLDDTSFLRNSGADLAGTQGPLAHDGDLDPVLLTRTDPALAYNQVTVEYEDRNYDYNNTPYRTDDLPAVTAYGRIPMPTMSLPAIKLATCAQQVAQLRLQREQLVRNTYEFNLGWKYSLLEPMDLVTLTDAGLGLSKTVVRIVSIEETADEQGFHIKAEEWPLGTATATLYPTATASGSKPAANVDPGNTNTPIILEAPTPLAQSALDLLIGASGGANWGGCDVYYSTDNVTFTKVGSIVGKACYGTLTATLATNAAWPTTDSTHTLAVDVGTSGRTMSTFSATDFAALRSLCYVNGEWLAYETATLTSAGKYNLTTLYRGLYNSTIPASHSIGESFALIDSAFLHLPLPAVKSGQTIYFKLPAFNIYGAATQDISTVSSVSYVVVNNPVPFTAAIPQGTVSIDSNGSWSASADGPSNAASYRWSSSTSSFPADATVQSGGTLVSGRTFSVSAGGTLTFGQTVYITIVPFTNAGGNGNPLPAIHIRGSYQTYTATKTVNYSCGSYRPDLATLQWLYSTTGTGTGPGAAMFMTGTGYNAAQNMWFSTIVPIPDGVTITGMAHWLWGVASTKAGTLGISGSMQYEFDRANNDATLTNLSSGSHAGNLGWIQLTDNTLNESTTGRQYVMRFLLVPAISGPNSDFTCVAGGNFSVTYSMPSPDKAI